MPASFGNRLTEDSTGTATTFPPVETGPWVELEEVSSKLVARGGFTAKFLARFEESKNSVRMRGIFNLKAAEALVAGEKIAKLPAEFRPPNPTITTPVQCGSIITPLEILANGEIKVIFAVGAGNSVFCETTYAVTNF